MKFGWWEFPLRVQRLDFHCLAFYSRVLLIKRDRSSLDWYFTLSCRKHLHFETSALQNTSTVPYMQGCLLEGQICKNVWDVIYLQDTSAVWNICMKHLHFDGYTFAVYICSNKYAWTFVSDLATWFDGTLLYSVDQSCSCVGVCPHCWQVLEH